MKYNNLKTNVIETSPFIHPATSAEVHKPAKLRAFLCLLYIHSGSSKSAHIRLFLGVTGSIPTPVTPILHENHAIRGFQPIGSYPRP